MNASWEPERFANLNRQLGECLELTAESPKVEELKRQLEKLKPELASLLEYPAKNAQHRTALEKGTPTINGEQFKVSTDFVAEATKLSDFLEIDEDLAAALVHKAVGYEKRFELAAGESAVLLYFSEREAKLESLRTLFAGGASSGVDEGVRTVLEQHASEILSSTLKAGSAMFPERVLAAIETLAARQGRVAAVLSGPSADVPYQREVVEFVQTRVGEERKQLAMLLFVVMRDYQLNSGELLAVVSWLRSSSVDDAVTLRLAGGLLVALGTGEGSEQAEAAALDKVSHLVRDSAFLVRLNTAIVDEPWCDAGLKGVVWLQWALLALFGMKRSPGFDQLIGFREDRVESIAEQAVRMGAYRCAADYLLGHRIDDAMEYELADEFAALQQQRTDLTSTVCPRYPHFDDVPEELQWQLESTMEDLLAAFIGRMSSLVRRMRYSEEDALYQAQQSAVYQTAQSEPVRRDTEALFAWVTVLFTARGDAALRFWGRGEPDDRLAVFVRWGADCREQGMVRAYFGMLAALASGSQASVCAHEFMSGGGAGGPRQAANQAPLCSWQALFGALDFYAGQLRPGEPDPLAAPPPEIPDAEVALLRAFLRLCRSVVQYSVVARTAIYDSTELGAMRTMFALLACVVPVALKAALLDTVAAFGALDADVLANSGAQADSVRRAVDEMARRIWAQLEQSQMLPTAGDGTRALAVGRGGNSARGGIAYELEEVEAAAETYPETRAFVRLVASLTHVPADATGMSSEAATATASVPADLGAAYRVPGIGPYVAFVLDSVLLKAEQRAYRVPSEKWRVYALALDVVERSLATLDLSAFVGTQSTVTPDSLRALATHPGFEVAVRVLCGSRLLDALLRVLDAGVDAVNAGDAAASAVLPALRILLRVLRVETAVLRGAVPALAEADSLGFALNLPRSLTTLEQLLLSRRASVVQIAALVGAVDPHVSLAAVRVVHILADSAVFNGVDDRVARGALTLNRLVSMIDGSADSVRILHAFITSLEAEGGDDVEVEDGDDDDSAAALRVSVVDLLLANVVSSKPAPTIAHYLLGFSVARPATDDLPDPAQRATVLHTVLDLLRGDSLLARQPRLAERCYHLIHRLCADPVTSDVMLRYLRARENFVSTQLRAVPAAIAAERPRAASAELHARAWLWRTSALELHSLVLQDSRPRAKLIAEWLVADAAQSDDADVFAPRPSVFLDAQMHLLALFGGVRQAYRDAATALQLQRRDAELENSDVDAMDADDVVKSDDAATADDAALLGVDISSCVAPNARGCAVYDLSALAALLRQAERALEATGALGSAASRQRVHAAMRRLTVRCYFANQERELFFAYASALRGWKEMAEIVVTSAWERVEAGGRAARERTAFQLLRGLVQAVSEHDAALMSAEDEARHAEVLAALASTLTLFSERLSLEWTRAGVLTRASLAAAKPGAAGHARALPPATDSQLPVEPLLDAWRQLVLAALTPAAQASLQLRGNVYASMLHFLGGVRKLAAAAADEGEARPRSRLVSGALDVLTNSTLGDRLLETASADAADASDAWKTVAFSLLDAIAALYASEARPNRVVLFLTRKNFFSSYIGALIRREDQALQLTLQPDPASLNALYIYEAKMAFFIRLAQRQDGADKLIENGVLDVLADCSFLDMRPSASSDATGFADAFIPARAERFHQLLMPALDLVLALAAKIGRDNVTVWMKVARFVSQHHGVLEAVLKETALPAHPLSMALLAEAKAASALVFYVSRQRAVLDREAALAGSGHVGVTSLHLPMLALLPKLGTSRSWIQRLTPANDVERAQAQVPAALFDDEDATEVERSVFGQQASELVDAVVQNAIAYAQAVTERPAGGSRPFRPAFSWPIEHSRESDYLPSLALLVAFVRRSLAQISRGRRARDEKLRLAQNSAEMTTADLRKLVAASPYVEASDDLSTTQMRALASVLLSQQGRRIGSSISMLVSTVEQALVLLWRHLSFFVTVDTADDSYGSRTAGSMALPSAVERDTLRTDASISLPPLLASLSELKLTGDDFVNAATHSSFIQMLVRRIKDLVLRDTSTI
ncbi:hypothetical protein GGF43_002377 [Coemansia sp. RSA 2618]|nr:hypothetical protein GGF43_002377 [Coemansia sp. RSA 2618]